jgi:hypothetical protein
MKRVSELIDQQLKWVQPSALKMHYELRAGDELVATLRFRSTLGTFATAESADGCWTFKRIGFRQTRVTVRACGVDTDIATFNNNTWKAGGTLEFPDGRKFPATTNFWQTKLEFQNESGDTLIQFQSGGLMHLSATVEIQHSPVGLSELPMMVILGWYLIVMIYMDAAVIGGVSATSAG